MTTLTTPRELTDGMDAGGLVTADMVLNVGPQHPATHGVLRLRLVIDGERIISAEPIVGYMHRGAEKLFEVRDYRQIMVLANRHDWLSGFANELGVALVAEEMLGMEVPERATWARTLLAELTRVVSHLVFLGSYPLELGAIHNKDYCRVLEAILVFENDSRRRQERERFTRPLRVPHQPARFPRIGAAFQNHVDRALLMLAQY